MNRKIIKSILSKKINNWIKSIKDPEVQELCRVNTIVTGGWGCNHPKPEKVPV